MEINIEKICHTCVWCIADEEEHLKCELNDESKNFDDSCEEWEMDIEMI